MDFYTELTSDEQKLIYFHLVHSFSIKDLTTITLESTKGKERYSELEVVKLLEKVSKLKPFNPALKGFEVKNNVQGKPKVLTVDGINYIKYHNKATLFELANSFGVGQDTMRNMVDRANIKTYAIKDKITRRTKKITENELAYVLANIHKSIYVLGENTDMNPATIRKILKEHTGLNPGELTSKFIVENSHLTLNALHAITGNTHSSLEKAGNRVNIALESFLYGDATGKGSISYIRARGYGNSFTDLFLHLKMNYWTLLEIVLRNKIEFYPEESKLDYSYFGSISPFVATIIERNPHLRYLDIVNLTGVKLYSKDYYAFREIQRIPTVPDHLLVSRRTPQVEKYIKENSNYYIDLLEAKTGVKRERIKTFLKRENLPCNERSYIPLAYEDFIKEHGVLSQIASKLPFIKENYDLGAKALVRLGVAPVEFLMSEMMHTHSIPVIADKDINIIKLVKMLSKKHSFDILITLPADKISSVSAELKIKDSNINSKVENILKIQHLLSPSGN